ncbi:MAG: transposase [Syntrophomonadaceae bacterium]|nr:transposase [Syntrophomonadaceae bacterium]
MPRQAREKSKTGVYHVMVRGINRQQIFHDQEDFRKYLRILQRSKELSKYKLFAYCLMINHVHLLIQEDQEEISQVMKRIGTSYAWWYNRKYHRTGHVFQDRYRSEKVEDDQYLLTVIRYIHRNPVKAGICRMPQEYPWSSCASYYGQEDYPLNLIYSELILQIFGQDIDKAQQRFRDFMEEDNEDSCLEDNSPCKMEDEVLYREIIRIMGNRPLEDLQLMPKKQRDWILKQLKQIEGTSLRQISRVTGIGLNIIFKA